MNSFPLSEALRVLLEQQLSCTCSAMNRPYVSVIHLETSGRTTCDQCGRVGVLQDFQAQEVMR